MDRCINCGIATGRCNTLGKRALDEEATLSVIRKWRASETVNSSDHVCQACWNLAQEVISGRRPITVSSEVGHSNVCLRCGRSLTSQRVTHQLSTSSARELRIYNVIRKWIMPRTVGVASRICHSCWVLADRAAVHMVYGPSTSSHSDPPQQMHPESLDLPAAQSEAQPQQMQPQPIDLPAVQPEPQPNQSEPTIVLPDYMRAIETELTLP